MSNKDSDGIILLSSSSKVASAGKIRAESSTRKQKVPETKSKKQISGEIHANREFNASQNV